MELHIDRLSKHYKNKIGRGSDLPYSRKRGARITGGQWSRENNSHAYDL